MNACSMKWGCEGGSDPSQTGNDRSSLVGLTFDDSVRVEKLSGGPFGVLN